MIDPDIQRELIRHAASVGLFFCAVAVICIIWHLANGV